MDQKHIIIIEVDDELPDIYEKLKSTKAKEIHLFVPGQSILLQSLINLKILKRKADELKKNITIITKDRKNIQRIESAGLAAIEDKSFDPTGKKKSAVAENEKQGLWAKFRRKIEGEKKKMDDKPYIFSKPSRRPLLLFVILAGGLFFLILYIALPSATIYVKPTLKLQKSTLNIELVSADRIGKITSQDDKTVGLYPVTAEYQRTIKLTPTGRVFKGTKSSGTVTLFNKTSEPRPIVANSRLQTNDGLVFLTNNFVTIPGGSANNPGQINVGVTARDKDASDTYIGARGNIAPTRFFLPGLSKSNQALIFGSNKDAFKGGTDDFEYFVTKNDLEVAKQKVISEVELGSVAELKKEVAKKDSDGTKKFKLFDRNDKVLSKNLVRVEVQGKENEKKNELVSTATMRASGFYYNEQDMESILLNNLTTKHISPTEKILKVQDNSLQIDEVLEVASDIPRVKVNASLQGIVAYDFLNNKLDLVRQIRDNVIGKSREDAEKYIDNLKEIDDARVNLWPIWSPTLPTIPENIKIEVET